MDTTTPDDVAKLLSEFSLTINYEGQGDFTPKHEAYDCTLSYGDKYINLTYQSNPEFTGKPTVTDIIQSMVSDAQSFNDHRSIDDFAAAFGYVGSDIPISQVISAYNGCKENYEWLSNINDIALSSLSDILNEHETEIREAVEKIHQEKAEFEAYTNPVVPEGFVSIQEVMQQFDLGDHGDQITNYDEDDYICDIFTEIADNNVDIYHYQLLSWLHENYEWLERADNQGMLENCKGDLTKMAQMAQYVCFDYDLYVHANDIVSYYVADKLYDAGVYMISDDLAEVLSSLDIDSDDILDTAVDTIKDEIQNQLTSHLEEVYSGLYDDISELVEEMTEEVIDSNFAKINPCIMHSAAARVVAELGYDQAFQNEWKDYLRDYHIAVLNYVHNHNKELTEFFNLDVWESLPTEEVFEQWYNDDFMQNCERVDHAEDMLDKQNESLARLDAMLDKPENRWNPFPNMVESDSPSPESGEKKPSISAVAATVKESAQKLNLGTDENATARGNQR